jgi:hypothetical protein
VYFPPTSALLSSYIFEYIQNLKLRNTVAARDSQLTDMKSPRLYLFQMEINMIGAFITSSFDISCTFIERLYAVMFTGRREREL